MESGLRKDTAHEMKELKDKDVKKNGDTTAYIDRANYLLEKYRSALFFLFAQGLVILYLIFGFLSIKENTVVEVMLPKVVKDTDYGKLKVGINSSNELYYKIFGSYIVSMILNSNSGNIEESIGTLKNLIFPDSFNMYAEKLDSFAAFIERNKASLKYVEYESTTSVDSSGEALYVSKGMIKTKIGDYADKDSVCTTKVRMITKNYMLFVTSFVKSCDEKSNKENGK